MWSLGGPAGAARQNWATPVRDSPGGWGEKEEEVTLDRFAAGAGWEIAGERPAGGAQAAWPRSAPVRRCSSLGEEARVVGEVVWHS
jgi:hypothetical protein